MYYNTHKWFITRQSVLLLVVNLAKIMDEQQQQREETIQRACWWIRMIRKRTMSRETGKTESRVLLVGTHIDQLGQEKSEQAEQLLLKAIGEAFSREGAPVGLAELVVDGRVYQVDSAHDTLPGVDALRRRLHQVLVVDKVTLMGETLPTSYLQLEALLETAAAHKPVLSMDEIKQMAAQGAGAGAPTSSSKL